MVACHASLLSDNRAVDDCRTDAGNSRAETFRLWLADTTVGGVVFAALMAWRNLRMGRGDRQGAIRLAAFAFLLGIAQFALRCMALPWDSISLKPQCRTRSGGQLRLVYIAPEPVVPFPGRARLSPGHVFFRAVGKIPAVARDIQRAPGRPWIRSCARGHHRRGVVTWRFSEHQFLYLSIHF